MVTITIIILAMITLHTAVAALSLPRLPVLIVLWVWEVEDQRWKMSQILQMPSV